MIGLVGDTPAYRPLPAAAAATWVPWPSASPGFWLFRTTSVVAATRPLSSGTFPSTPVSRMAIGLVVDGGDTEAASTADETNVSTPVGALEHVLNSVAWWITVLSCDP